ncbi:MAG: hypothetical protein U0R18_00570 [Mycobacterium sp.]
MVRGRAQDVVTHVTGFRVVAVARSGTEALTAARELRLVKPFEFGQLRTKLEAFAARSDTLASAGEVSAAECAETVGISRVSARRYLEHYLGTGLLEIRLQYGTGRPERRYRVAG